MDELLRTFLPRFLKTCEERLRRAELVLYGGESVDARGFAHEMHALGGEAAVLDLRAIQEIAREGELAGKKWAATLATGELDQCRAVLARIRVALEAISAES